MIARFRAWKDWCKYTNASWYNRILVLLGLKNRDFFEQFWVRHYKKGGANYGKSK